MSVGTSFKWFVPAGISFMMAAVGRHFPPFLVSFAFRSAALPASSMTDTGPQSSNLEQQRRPTRPKTAHVVLSKC